MKWPIFPEKRKWDGTRYIDQADINRWKVEMRRVLATLVPETGYSRCWHCNLPWWIVDGHTIEYRPGSACFTVCEICWRDVPHRELLPYYLAWLDKEYPGDTAKKEALKATFDKVPA
jgi:hypothetical protein